MFFQFLGDGLLNSKGEKHRRQRRLMLPAFHRSQMTGYGRSIVESAAAIQWTDGEVRDVGSDMMTLTLNIVASTLFSSNAEQDAKSISEAFGELTRQVNRLSFPNAK